MEQPEDTGGREPFSVGLCSPGDCARRARGDLNSTYPLLFPCQCRWCSRRTWGVGTGPLVAILRGGGGNLKPHRASAQVLQARQPPGSAVLTHGPLRSVPPGGDPEPWDPPSPPPTAPGSSAGTAAHLPSPLCSGAGSPDRPVWESTPGPSRPDLGQPCLKPALAHGARAPPAKPRPHHRVLVCFLLRFSARTERSQK